MNISLLRLSEESTLPLQTFLLEKQFASCSGNDPYFFRLSQITDQLTNVSNKIVGDLSNIYLLIIVMLR